MQEQWRSAAAKWWVCLFVLLLPLTATAQPSAVGVVTRVQGRVELTRRPAPTPVALQFKDDLFLRDLVDTFERSMARMLFGGQSSVTVREFTRFEVRAEILPSGATRTVYDLVDGKIRVIVAPQLMRPGDEVQIRTPNAVAGIRGTTIVVERNQKTDRDVFTMLDDCTTFTPQGKLPFDLCEGTRVAMTGSQVESVETITQHQVAQLQAEFDMGSSHPGEANRAQILETHLRTGEQLMTALVETATGQTSSFQAETSTGGLFSDANADRTPLDEAPLSPAPLDVPDVLISNTSVTLNVDETLKTFSGSTDRTGFFSPVVQITDSTVTQSSPPNLLANGGFESGNLTGWTVFNQTGGVGVFSVQSGTTSPLTGFPVPAPPGATFAAMTDQLACCGSHTLYQDFTVPASGLLQFDLFIGNRAADFFSPPSLDYTFGIVGQNQQARVDIVDRAATDLDPQDVGAGVIQNLFQTNPGDALVSGYNTFVFDVSALTGQNVRLRFAETDNQNFFQFGVDNVSLTTQSNIVRFDTALFEASAPILSVIGTAPGQASVTSGGATLDLFKSTVTTLGPVVALDNGLINVQNGPVIRLANGSSMIVTGDLFNLINASRINVLNGPLASVDGVGSLLNVSGALANFGGTGGNQIVVNNNITPTATLSGLPVSATTGGSITIGPNPVTNPALGNISVNGSLISATQGGSVNIAAP